jgi:hypothetical protein
MRSVVATSLAGLVLLTACVPLRRGHTVQECFALSYGEWRDVSPGWGAPVTPSAVRFRGHVRGSTPAEGSLHGYSRDPAWWQDAPRYRAPFTWWRASNADALAAQFGSGFGRLIYEFAYVRNELRGEVRAISDNATDPQPSTSVTGRPIPCSQVGLDRPIVDAERRH